MARTANGRPRTRRSYLIDDELIAWIEEVATARDMSQNLVVERALQHYREVLPPMPPEPNTPAALLSAVDAMTARR